MITFCGNQQLSRPVGPAQKGSALWNRTPVLRHIQTCHAFKEWLASNPLPTVGARREPFSLPPASEVCPNEKPILVAAAPVHVATMHRFHAMDLRPAMRALAACEARVTWDTDQRMWIGHDVDGMPAVHVIWPPAMRRPGALDSPTGFLQLLRTNGSDTSEGESLWDYDNDSHRFESGQEEGEGQYQGAEAEAEHHRHTNITPAEDSWRPPTGDMASQQSSSNADQSAENEEDLHLLRKHTQWAQRARAAAGPGSATAGVEGGLPGLEACLIVLLSYGSAVVGIWDGNGELTHHKVLTGYTIRRGNGKAQARHEQRGGGRASAGAAIRNQETRRLWQAAAAKLQEWDGPIQGCGRLFACGDVRVWNMLYEARRPAVPVARQDVRWERVGLPVARPRLRDLLRTYRALCLGKVILLRSQPPAV